MNCSGKLVKEMIVPHVQRQLVLLKNQFGHHHSPGPPKPRCAQFAPMASTVTIFILHQFWSSKRDDKAQAARDLLMVISQTKRADFCFLMPSPRPPSLPQTWRYSLSEESVLHRSEHLLPRLPLISPLCLSLLCCKAEKSICL